MFNLYFKVGNLRSIRSMGYVQLKPVTILVGKNNSGKSSFLRTFQLLRRSIETFSSAPIIWQGNPVDFGDFASAITDNLIDQRISFCFKLENVKLEHNGHTRMVENMEYKVFLGSFKNRTIIRKIEFILVDYDFNVSVDFSNDGADLISFTINGSTITTKCDIFSNYKVIIDKNEIFPSFSLVHQDFPNFKEKFSSVFGSAIFTHLQQTLIEYDVHENIPENLFLNFISDLLGNPLISNSFVNNKIGNKTADVKFQNMYSRIAKHQALIDQIQNFCSTYWTFKSINSSCRILREFFVQNIYIGPERIRVQRYYPIQEIDITSISHEGGNFPMFLNSLSESEMFNFTQWIESLLGVKLDLQQINNLVRIFYYRKGINRVNLIDAGYGLSQVLPIFAQIWITSKKCSELAKGQPFHDYNRINDNILPITIEQPEAHLHPAFQEKIMEALSEATRTRNMNHSPIFIIETHSKKIIDRLSVLIRSGELDRRIVNVVLFSTREDMHSFRMPNEQDDIYSHVSESHFNVKGRLENWPYGFLR